jgi:ribokinase
MEKILVVGSSNTDLIIKLAEIPRPGETLLGGEFKTFPGVKEPTRLWLQQEEGEMWFL